MSMVALVNTANHLFVRREPVNFNTENQVCEHVHGRIGEHSKPLICMQRTS